MTLRGEELSVRGAIYTLDTFCLGSDLIMDWDKSCGYWWSPDGLGCPDWTEVLHISWVEDGDVSKLLGSIFGLNLDTSNVDKFLLDHIHKKLEFWCTIKINTAGRTIVINHVLLSSLFFFIAIWAGSQAGVGKYKSAIQNYMWSGSLHQS